MSAPHQPLGSLMPPPQAPGVCEGLLLVQVVKPPLSHQDFIPAQTYKTLNQTLPRLCGCRCAAVLGCATGCVPTLEEDH